MHNHPLIRLYQAFIAMLAPWAPLPLRLIVGYGFMAHGYAKILKGPDNFIAILHNIGMPMAHVLGWATILIELIGGLGILLGACVPLLSVPMVVVLAVAAVTVHWPYGFSSIKLMAYANGQAQFGQPGYETDLLYIACIVALVLGGPGPWTVDNLLLKRFRKRR